MYVKEVMTYFDNLFIIYLEDSWSPDTGTPEYTARLLTTCS